MLVAGIVLVVAGLVVAGNIGWFYLRQHVEGENLVHQEDRAIAGAHASRDASCAPLSDTSSGPQGLVEAKAIGMTAPVVGGDGATQLAVAVGHVPGSAWPGQRGTSILAAHDVTYFSDIDQLRQGSLVDFATPCASYVYQVSGHQVVDEGTPIYSNSAQSELVLETCYPTDALFLTDQRFLVTASLVATSTTGVPTPHLATPVTPTVPAPAALAAQGLTLATNDAELGTLALSGSPAPSWSQSMAPFDDESAVLADYFGAIRSAEQDQQGWWSALAPGVPMATAAPLSDATISGYGVALGVTLDAAGSTLTGASLQAHVYLATGPNPGEYILSAMLVDESGVLVITRWSMTPI